MPDIALVVLGFDFGMKRIGVAVGQTLTNSAQPLSSLAAHQGTPDWQRITDLIAQWNAQAFVVGIPKNVDDSDQFTTHLARQFANQLAKRFALPVHRVDERYTTKEARQQIFDEGGYRALQSADVDCYAAKLIVEQWMRQRS